MKAIVTVRIKATGEIKEVARGIYYPYQYVDKEGTIYTEDDVEELPGDDGVMFYDPTIDYWTRLEHQFAGMAMQGMIRTVGHDRMYPPEKIAIYAEACAHALVQKLKEVK